MAGYFKDNTAQVYREIEGRIELALEEICREIEHKVRFKYVPVDKGRLKNSIQHKVEGTKGVVFTDVEYAAAVEFGHHQEVGRYVPAIGKRLVKGFVPGQHYMKRAGENHRDEYVNILRKHL